MPYDASGNAQVTRSIAVTGQTAQAAQVNVPFDDIQSMLSQALLKSGVAPMQGNLNANTFKFINLGDPSASGDAVNKSSLDNSVSGLETKISQSSARVQVKTANYTAVAEDTNSLIRFTAGTQLTLPDVAMLPDNWNVEVWGDGTEIRIATTLSQTINGSLSNIVYRGQVARVFKLASAFVSYVESNTLSGLSVAGLIYGLRVSANSADAANDVDISTGHAAADLPNYSVMELLSPITKRIDAIWSAGSGQGGLDTGAPENRLYYMWLIQRSDTGAVDAIISASGASPILPSSFDRKRLVGSFLRASNVNISFSSESQEKRIGVGQIWQFQNSKTVNTPYLNDTGRPIQVLIASDTTGSGGFQLSIDGGSNYYQIGYSSIDAVSGGTTNRLPASGPYTVPAHTYYRFTGNTFFVWHELR